jgi:hypothetical protein
MDDVRRRYCAAPLSKDQVIVRIAILVMITSLIVAARFYNPFESELIGCQFKNLTGFDCPTCGVSRSMYSVMNFQIWNSIAYNPLGVMAVVGLLFSLLKMSIELLLKREISFHWKKNTLKIVLFTLTSVIAINWMIKLAAQLQL